MDTIHLFKHNEQSQKLSTYTSLQSKQTLVLNHKIHICDHIIIKYILIRK